MSGESHCGQAVIRRVGGLEVYRRTSGPCFTVIRRVGGLEENLQCGRLRGCVIRRVDGLEVISFWSKVSSSDMVPPNVHVELKYPR